MSTQMHIKSEFLPGTPIEDACAEAVRVATILGCVVEFDFNGVCTCAKPNDDPLRLAEAWQSKMHSESEYKIAYAHNAPRPTRKQHKARLSG